MGLNQTWISVEAQHRERLLDHLGFEVADEAEHELAAEFTFAEHPDGWVIVVADQHGLTLDKTLRALSTSCGFAVGCEIIETVTFSEARACRNGDLAWSVVYNPEENGRGLVTAGEPPPALGAIEARLSAEQARDPSVAYLFDAPLDLAASICGRRVDEDQGLQWFALEKKGRGDRRAVRKGVVARRSKPEDTSLRDAIWSELVPLLRTLGWPTDDQPELAEHGKITRNIDGVDQSLWFDFARGVETHIIVHFVALDAASGGDEFARGGRVIPAQVHVPLWNRFTWKRFAELARGHPIPDNIIAAVIERARADIHKADEYLRSLAPSPYILIAFARPSIEEPSRTGLAGRVILLSQWLLRLYLRRRP
ncbi:MAG: uncharacterized protein JWM33_3482 [Caulobacteraceae bacterium]|nr:uncharacterized protein [Caulobacteraceae bacterium]